MASMLVALIEAFPILLIVNGVIGIVQCIVYGRQNARLREQNIMLRERNEALLELFHSHQKEK